MIKWLGFLVHGSGVIEVLRFHEYKHIKQYNNIILLHGSGLIEVLIFYEYKTETQYNNSTKWVGTMPVYWD